jgi:hypothetical protein
MEMGNSHQERGRKPRKEPRESQWQHRENAVKNWGNAESTGREGIGRKARREWTLEGCREK